MLRLGRDKSARMTNFSDKYLGTQMVRNLATGDRTRFLNHLEFFKTGIKRGKTRGINNDNVAEEERNGCKKWGPFVAPSETDDGTGFCQRGYDGVRGDTVQLDDSDRGLCRAQKSISRDTG